MGDRLWLPYSSRDCAPFSRFMAFPASTSRASKPSPNLIPAKKRQFHPTTHDSIQIDKLNACSTNMPVQRTFTLIPESPAARVRANASPAGHSPPLRPMTSRQARQAYKEANRAPRRSRAEIARAERAEQERIRREFEKEKSAARARAARGKRLEKELAEKGRKRREGLPLVSVRPSQDTIARFVRGNGSGRKRDGRGEQVELETEEGETGEGETGGHTGADDKPDSHVAGAEGDEIGLDMILEGDELDQELLDEFDAAAAVEPPRKRHRPENESTQGHPDPPPPPPPPPMGRPKAPKERREVTIFEEDLGLAKPIPEHRPHQPDPIRNPSPPIRRSPTPSPPHQNAPLSTQAIFSNFDAFFPTTSQLARELEEEFPAKQPATRSAEPFVEAAVSKTSQTKPASPERGADEAGQGRFFTSSGTREVMSLAMHRSRRTAAREKWHRRQDDHTLPVLKAQSRSQAATHTPHQSHLQPNLSAKTEAAKVRAMVSKAMGFDKENALPPDARPPVASQETEYGGDWVDDLAQEIWV